MSVTISIRFLTGRAHLHPWQTHHSEGRVEWPPSQWRLLRALVAVAGRGPTSLPYPDEVPPPRPDTKITIDGVSSLKKRGVPDEAKGKLSLARSGILTLKAQMTDAEADAWKAANPGEAFATALDQLRQMATSPDPVAMGDVNSDEIPLSRLAGLLHALLPTPSIWLPKTAGGHTRQYFPIHKGGTVKNTGSAVFDTFATVGKDQPLLFHWADSSLSELQFADLQLLLGRMTYFGRAESWCRAEAYACPPANITADGMSEIVPGTTHWECRCIEDHGKPAGKEYRDYLLERRLAPVTALKEEVPELLPRTNPSEGRTRDQAKRDKLKSLLETESPDKLLLRCLLRESGQDIKDGLERPIGARWVHYAVPRAVYAVPRPKSPPRRRRGETVDLVRYALNTATVGRAVLPSVTDTLLVADKFRSAVMRLCGDPGRSVSGHEADGSPCKGHQHAFWWPLDEDNDSFIDHVIVWSPGGFEQHEVDALRRLTRLEQRGRRPDLLVTPIYVGLAEAYPQWREGHVTRFLSATPYHCPLNLSHGRTGGGRPRPITRVIREGLRRQGITEEIEEISEIVFDYAPDELMATLGAVAARGLREPTQPRQYFAVVEPPSTFPPLPRFHETVCDRIQGACLKDPDTGYPFGLSVGLRVGRGERFVRAMSFCRRRGNVQAKGDGRMFLLRFREPRLPRPFAIGDQCHFGLGLFLPVPEHPRTIAGVEVS